MAGRDDGDVGGLGGTRQGDDDGKVGVSSPRDFLKAAVAAGRMPPVQTSDRLC